MIIDNDPHREFLFEFADYQLAYEKGRGLTGMKSIPDPAGVINPPVKDEVGLPFLVEKAQVCPNGTPPPCPEAVSAADPGTMSVNYRNEPVPMRVRDPFTNTCAAGAPVICRRFTSQTSRAPIRTSTCSRFYPALTKE